MSFSQTALRLPSSIIPAQVGIHVVLAGRMRLPRGIIPMQVGIPFALPWRQPDRRREKMAGSPPESTMDAERINLIGNQLADLAARTAALRGYL
jgi:hypothetical protein